MQLVTGKHPHMTTVPPPQPFCPRTNLRKLFVKGWTPPVTADMMPAPWVRTDIRKENARRNGRVQRNQLRLTTDMPLLLATLNSGGTSLRLGGRGASSAKKVRVGYLSMPLPRGRPCPPRCHGTCHLCQEQRCDLPSEHAGPCLCGCGREPPSQPPPQDAGESDTLLRQINCLIHAQHAMSALSELGVAFALRRSFA